MCSYYREGSWWDAAKRRPRSGRTAAAHHAIGIREKRRRDPSRSYEPSRKRRDRMSAIILAAREPRGRAQASAASPAGAAAPETRSAHDAPAPVTGEGELARPADGRIAA